MKFLASILAAAALLVACNSKKVADDNKLRTGDLIFIGIPASYTLDSTSIADAISDATGNDTLNLIHVAIAEVEADTTWIIDATIKYNTDRHPLDSMLQQFKLRGGVDPTYIVKRLPDSCDVKAAIERAKTFCGQPYDMAFTADNGAMYCSELVQNSFLDSKGNRLFQSQPMNFKNKDGEFPTYWVQLFELLGSPIPQDMPGTNPQDMSTSPLLRTVNADIL